MLKFDSHSRNIVSLGLRNKESFFSRDLKRGLLCALFFHLGLLISFQVIRQNCGEKYPLLPPVNVEIDLKKESPLTSSQRLLLTPFSKMQLPFEPLPPTPSKPIYGEEWASNEPDFSVLETIPYSPARL